MKIKRIDIYGFGKWQDKSFDLEGKGFVAIIGDNETGKTTLRAFILFILFGLSPQKRQRYLPKQGGKLGGRLVVIIDDKDYTIERIHDRNQAEPVCYNANGQLLSKDWLFTQLNGVTRALFDQIFNFDVLSLQIGEQLTRDQLGQVLLSVGMTGSDRIYQAEKNLKQHIQSQFKPQGRKPQLNQMIELLDEQADKVKQLEDDIPVYIRHQQLKREYQKQVEQTEQELQSLNSSLVALKEQQRLYPSLENYQLVSEQLNAYPDPFPFPEQGEARFKQLKDGLQPLEAEYEVTLQKITDLKTDLNALQDKMTSSQIKQEIDQVLKQSQSYLEERTWIKQHKQQIDEYTEEINERLDQLKLAITETELLNLPFGYGTGETWQHISERYVKFNEEKTILQKNLTKLKEEHNKQSQDWQLLKDHILTSFELETLKDEKDQLMDAITQSKSSLSKEQLDQLATKQRSVQYILFACLTLVAISPLIISFEWWWLSGFIMILGTTVLINNKRIERHVLSMTQDWRDQHQKEITACIERKKQIDDQLNEHHTYRDQFILLEQVVERNETDQLKVGQQLDRVEQQLQILDQSIDEQRSLFPLLKQLTPERWSSLYDRLHTLIELIKKRDQLMEHQQNLIDQQGEFEDRVQTGLAGMLDFQSLSFIDALEELKTISIEQKKLLQQQETLTERLAYQEEALKTLTAKMRPFQNEINSLLEKAAVEDEEAFIGQAQAYEHWHQLKGKQMQLAQQIKLHLPEQQSEWLKIGGHPVSLSSIEDKINTCQGQLEALNERLNQLRQQVADQQAILKQHEQSRQLVDVKHDYYYLKESFEWNAKQWLTYQLALKQIEKTKEKFQISYLPTVLEKASYYFNKVTGQNYQHLFFDDHEQRIHVLTATGVSYQLDELSQGTLDQLFISIRFAISEWLAIHATLPFLIDDGFVHFDQNRYKVIYQMIKELKGKHQIIFFTKSSEIFANKGLANQDKYITL
ncbi:ATP-binding protein [Amphibacillus jilinensis]|uniref:ATP-binding protein n=1 Tax=Amphibacillus jilinensis TaxID=1216008 RepID=UPI000307A717|nr:AAA family ATPase [Amphibacillus jilinensis]